MGVDGLDQLGSQGRSLPGESGFGQVGDRFHHPVCQPSGRGKLDVGADAIARAPLGHSRGDALGQPPFDPPRRHRHQLGIEQPAPRPGQLVAQPRHQGVGMRSDVDLYPHGRQPIRKV
jgi:hypothetical protein